MKESGIAMGPNPIEAQLDDAFEVERHHLVDEASRRKRRDVFFLGWGKVRKKTARKYVLFKKGKIRFF
jgi:hypothetical protein